MVYRDDGERVRAELTEVKAVIAAIERRLPPLPSRGTPVWAGIIVGIVAAIGVAGAALALIPEAEQPRRHRTYVVEPRRADGGNVLFTRVRADGAEEVHASL